MNTGDHRLREVVRALCVLALVFLNFAHAPLAAGGGLVAAPLVESLCGDPFDAPSEAGTDPCQACRIGSSADLPPACEQPEAKLPVLIRLEGSSRPPALARPAPLPGRPRAPPAA